MTEAMIDLETLDTGPRSVVLSIGATIFSQDEGAAPYESFYSVLDLDAQLRMGRTVSQSTLRFWLEPDDAVRREAFGLGQEPAVPVSMACEGLEHYHRGVDDVWANSPSFDCVIWESLCHDFGRMAPWRYNQTRDVRTLREIAGVPRDWSPPTRVARFGPHHPVDDCLWQVEVVREARRRLEAGRIY